MSKKKLSDLSVVGIMDEEEELGNETSESSSIILMTEPESISRDGMDVIINSERNKIIDTMENESNENKIDLKTNYTVTMKNGEDFKTELQKNIDQYKYEFEKRLYNVLNKDIFNTQFDPTKNIFDTNGNFSSNLDKNNGKNQKSRRKSQNNLNQILKNKSFIFSNSALNYDFGSSLNDRRKFKSENNINDYKKRASSSRYSDGSYNNISSSRPIGFSLNDLDRRFSKGKYRKDYQIRKTFEDLQKELNNLENEFKNNTDEYIDEKMIDLRKKELHKNYKEYIKYKSNKSSADTPNLRRYKNYVNDYEWKKQRHLDAIAKQNTPKTTTEIDKITERLYNPNNYPNVYKMKLNTTKSTEKLDSNVIIIFFRIHILFDYFII